MKPSDELIEALKQQFMADAENLHRDNAFALYVLWDIFNNPNDDRAALEIKWKASKSLVDEYGANLKTFQYKYNNTIFLREGNEDLLHQYAILGERLPVLSAMLVEKRQEIDKKYPHKNDSDKSDKLAVEPTAVKVKGILKIVDAPKEEPTVSEASDIHTSQFAISYNEQRRAWIERRSEIQENLNHANLFKQSVQMGFNSEPFKPSPKACENLLRTYGRLKVLLNVYNKDRYRFEKTDQLTDHARAAMFKGYRDLKAQFTEIETYVNSVRPQLEQQLATANIHLSTNQSHQNQSATQSLSSTTSASVKSVLKQPSLATRIFNAVRDIFYGLTGVKRSWNEAEHFVERPSTYDAKSIDYRKAEPDRTQKRNIEEINRERNKIKIIDMSPKASKVKFDENASVESLGGGKGALTKKKEKENIEVEALRKVDPSISLKGP